ncbi:MAG TPA: hypothetical protein VK824_06185 [Planctomycetota bacterium]|nr:hypothetical protein [Planctomycetota bacterium]
MRASLATMIVVTVPAGCHATASEAVSVAASASAVSAAGGSVDVKALQARVTSLASSGWHPDLALEQAESVLRSAAYVATARTGRSGHPDPQAIAFVRVLLDETATARFAALAGDNNACARVYGLCGLHLLSCAAFDEAVTRDATPSGTVMFWSGCVGAETEVSEILAARVSANVDVSRGGLPLTFVALAEDLSHQPSPRAGAEISP